MGAGLARPFIACWPGAPGPPCPPPPGERRWLFLPRPVALPGCEAPQRGCSGAAGKGAPRGPPPFRAAGLRASSVSPPPRPAETFPSPAGSRLGRGGGRPRGRRAGRARGPRQASFPCPVPRACAGRTPPPCPLGDRWGWRSH